MAKKPSFFEKLTGTSWSKDDALGERIKAADLNASKRKTAVKTKAVKSKAKPKPKSVLKSEAGTPVNLPKEEVVKEEPKDWLGESEGQLTIDVYQTPSEIVIKSTIAGVKSEDIDITMSNDMITIKGNREKDENIQEEDYYYQECYWGPFSRSIILPVDVEVDQVKAGMKNGILTIRLPKIEKAKTKKIEIKAE